MAPSEMAKSKKQKSTPKTVSDFTVLPLTLPALPSLPTQYRDAKHYIYIKPHSPSVPTPTAEKSLFVANVPIDATESNLRALFAEQLGGSRVERVEFDSAVPAGLMHKRWKSAKTEEAGEEGRGKKRKRNDDEALAEGVIEDEDSALPRIWNGELRTSGSGAVVVFVDKRSATGALKEAQRAVKEGRNVSWKTGEGLGVERTSLIPIPIPLILSHIYTKQKEHTTNIPAKYTGYKSHTTLTFPPAPTLQSTLNAYLTQFTALERLRHKSRKTLRTVPDEDGFITVARGGRVAPARIDDAEKKKAELDQRRKNNGVKDDFYRFQNREKRKEAEVRLRTRFDEDRRRVGEMRERRGRVRPEV